MTEDQLAFLLSSVMLFIFFQLSIILIGNRFYSMYYKSHALIKKKGWLKLIYFKPQHFHRYSIWKVLFFFLSYIQFLVCMICFGLSFAYDIDYFLIVLLLVFSLIIILLVVIRLILIDITYKKEENYMKKHSQNSELSSLEHIDIPSKKVIQYYMFYQSTIRRKLEELYEKRLKRISKDNQGELEKLDDEFIGYFRHYQDIDVQNEKVIFLKNLVNYYQIEFSFDSKKRETFPHLNDGTYWPHLMIDQTKTYLGVAFESSSIHEFDQVGEGIIRTIYRLDMYEGFLPNTHFTIREGNKIVGEGKIVSQIKNPKNN